jgi:alkyl hydroperoxide reductase subunit AhpF
MQSDNADTLAPMPILRAAEEAKVRGWFAELERPVELVVALGPEETPLAGSGDVDFGAEAVRLAEGLAELGESVSCRVEQEPDGFPRFPSISVRPESHDVGVRYDGLPWGYEMGSLVGAVVEAGKAEPSLRPESVAALAELERDLSLDVFVTPT